MCSVPLALPLGRIVELFDTTGVVRWRREVSGDPYLPGGEDTDPDLDMNHVYEPTGFPGQLSDSPFNTYYNYFRDYNPSTGRYIESDPIGLAGGLNTYSYALNNPLRYIDPTGLTVSLGACAGGPLGCIIGVGITGITMLNAINGTNDAISGENSKGTNCPTDDFCERNANRLNEERDFLIDAEGEILRHFPEDPETLIALNNEIVAFNREVDDHNRLCPHLPVLKLRTLGARGIF